MRINTEMSKKEVLFQVTFALLSVGFWVYVFFIFLRETATNKNAIIFLCFIGLFAVYQLYAVIVFIVSQNCELTLEEKRFTYKTFFIDIKEEYKQIKGMKVISKPLGRIMGDDYILKIRLKEKKTIYIALYTLPAKKSRALRELLIKKTGKEITGKKIKSNK